MSFHFAKSWRSICIASALGISLLAISSASGQSQTQTQTQTQTAQPPQRALANLYEVTKSIISDPKNEAEDHPGGSPTFPYPDAIQDQWKNSMNAYGTGLTQQERDAFVPCAAHLNAAIADMEKVIRLQALNRRRILGRRRARRKATQTRTPSSRSAILRMRSRKVRS